MERARRFERPTPTLARTDTDISQDVSKFRDVRNLLKLGLLGASGVP